VQLILGIISAVLSISWMIQLILEVFLQGLLGPYLSDIFQKLTAAFPLFGVVAYGIFAFYLLACVVKGMAPSPPISKIDNLQSKVASFHQVHRP
jgi:LMBR1 domain-containing protein 1